MIDEASYQAGERLRTDIMLAGLLPGVTARWDGMPKSGGPASPGEATDRIVAARQRLRHAFDAIGGDFSDLLLDLCGFLKGLEQIERERQEHARADQSSEEPETETHERRAERASYLKEKLDERAEAEDAAAREG
jgi:hypothetical protein